MCQLASSPIMISICGCYGNGIGAASPFSFFVALMAGKEDLYHVIFSCIPSYLHLLSASQLGLTCIDLASIGFFQVACQGLLLGWIPTMNLEYEDHMHVACPKICFYFFKNKIFKEFPSSKCSWRGSHPNWSVWFLENY